jgi:hypothetical protein
MKIVKEHINEIKRGGEGWETLGVGSAKLYKDLREIMQMKDCKFQWFSTETRFMNILANDGADLLKCNNKDLAIAEFEGNTIYKELKKKFGNPIDKFQRTNTRVNYTFEIWKDPDFLLLCDSAEWNNYSSKLQVYINNTKANIFKK